MSPFVRVTLLLIVGVQYQVQLMVYIRLIKNLKNEHGLNKKHSDAIKAEIDTGFFVFFFWRAAGRE